MNEASGRQFPWKWIVMILVAALLGLLAFAALRGPTGDPVRVMKEGVAWLERYQYARAYELFDGLTRRYPDWVAARVNKGLAALNLLDKYLVVAEEEFKRALELDPDNPYALHSLGILYRHTGRFDAAAAAFSHLVRVDPTAPFGRFYLGTTLMDLDRYEEAREALEEALRLQPSLSSAHWRLRAVYLKLKQVDRIAPAVAEFRRLEDAKVGLKADLKYGSSGKYSLAVRDSVPPGVEGGKRSPPPLSAPVFGPVQSIAATPALARERPDGRRLTPAFCMGDVTGDGHLELVLCGAVAPGGAAPAPRARHETGRVTVHARRTDASWDRIAQLDEDAALAALGDLDGDRDLDLVLAGAGWLRLYENTGTGRFQPATRLDVGASHAGFPVRLLLADADSDWDLDIICMRQVANAQGGVTSRLELLNNNRDGTFVDIAPEARLGPFDFAAGELVAADLDGDIDVDIIVLGADGAESVVFANERVWRYRRIDGRSAGLPALRELISSSLGDFDGDGDEDVAFFTSSGVELVLNEGRLRFAVDPEFGERFQLLGATTGVFGDFQGALELGLLLLAAPPREQPALLVPRGASASGIPVAGLDIGAAPATHLSAAFAAVVPCAPPELIIYDSEVGARSWPLAPGGHWLTLDLEGPLSPIPDKERANVGGVGAVVEVHVGARSQTVQLHTGGAGSVRLATRVALGLAGTDHTDFVRILWPDGILQAEHSLVACQLHRIGEVERKPSSCPILFAWTGTEYSFVGDFLGVGGLGYFEGPGRYNRPDSTEFLLLPELEALESADGVREYRLEVLEPLEECTYLDELKLTVVDHAADVTVLPDEMFAISGPAPGFRLLALREKVFPLRAWNLQGEEVTSRLREVDRVYGNVVERDRRFSGLAKREHGVVLEFAGDTVERLTERERRGGRLYLFLHGFIEYGYSTSNFAASQAGTVFEAPTFEVQRDGQWVPLRREWGFPAGYPRYMAVDLAGLLRRGDRRLRVRTNMEIHWDQVFLACVAPEPMQVTDLDVDSARLSFAGFLPERSPDGRLPKIYRYGEFKPTTTFKVFPGAYTRYGEVSELIAEADDRFAIFGPGDRLAMRIRADRLPSPAPGMQRTFLAKVVGYCKDMDLYTAHADRIEPLPFRSMTSYPYASDEDYPVRRELERYRSVWNTRSVEGTFLDGFDLPRAR